MFFVSSYCNCMRYLRYLFLCKVLIIHKLSTEKETIVQAKMAIFARYLEKPSFHVVFCDNSAFG